MRQVADVLEKTAELLDQQESAQQQQVRSEREKISQELGEKIASVMGEEFSPETLKRVVNADPEIAEAFHKLAARLPGNEAPDELGDVAEDTTADYEFDKTAADKQFYNWIME